MVSMPLSDEALFQIRRGDRFLREREERRHQLLAVAQRVAAVLKTEFGATRVLLFGSLVRPWFHEESDIDLAVEGITPSRQGEAWDRALDEASTAVDLVFLEEAPAPLRERILLDCRVLD
jgi:predicted nucleotidyltransferase